MSTNNHPIEHEELMAYLDGELATARAVAAAAHLEHCAECQELAAELRKISQELMAWEVEEIEPAEGMPIAIRAALQDVPKKSTKALKPRGWRVLLTRHGLAWAGSGLGLALFFIVFGVGRLNQSRPGAPAVRQEAVTATLVSPTPGATPLASYANGSLNAFSYAPENRTAKAQAAPTEDTGGDEVTGNEEKAGVPEIPMIARTAGLTLTTKEFDKARASLEDILKRHNGYMGELSVSAPSDTGRTLTATLLIPAQQLDSALAELKNLGRVENESQGGEEVTAQYVDLAARLANAQHTEQRLTEILRTRTGKLQDVLKVELEIDRVRGEIEQMQAERKELTKRVAFATLNTTVKEEYKARLQGAPPSTGSRFRNAAVDGYNTVVEGLIDVGLFLLSSGPSLLIWVAILFFPARWAWRKVRAELKKNQTEPA